MQNRIAPQVRIANNRLETLLWRALVAPRLLTQVRQRQAGDGLVAQLQRWFHLSGSSQRCQAADSPAGRAAQPACPRLGHIGTPELLLGIALRECGAPGLL